MPEWLATRMASLGRVITEAICHEYGRDEFLRRLSHPFWFQSFGAVMGMDWHSSGITTSVMAALKRGLRPVQTELGLYVCGGRGAQSARTPHELRDVGVATGIDALKVAKTSRLVARIDQVAVIDGFNLYQHNLVVTADEKWAVVQQGKNGRTGYARRYHWLGEDIADFLDSPHASMSGPTVGEIVNLADTRAARARDVQLALVKQGPSAVASAVMKATRIRHARAEPQAVSPHLALPAHHNVSPGDLILRRLHGTIAAVAERGPVDFADVLMVPEIGSRTLLTLAMVAETIHGAPSRFSDPARFSMALGGKDGHPFPVPLKVYDHTIDVLRRAMDRARLDNQDRLSAVRRLDEASRRLEQNASGPTLEEFVGEEWRHSKKYGGRTV